MQNSLKIKVAFIVIFFILIGFLGNSHSIINDRIDNAQSADSDQFAKRSAPSFTQNSPIHINNNWSEAVSAGIALGSGSMGDPYLIQNYEIDGKGSEYCILINNTYSTDYFKIQNCKVFNAEKGIYLYLGMGYYGWVLNNNISNTVFGIFMFNTQTTNISGNILSNNDHGIFIGGGQYNIFFNNNMTGCGFHPFMIGTALNLIDSSNLVNGKPVYYYRNEQGLGANNFTNAGQIILANCTNSVITNLNFSDGTIGISLHDSNNNTVAGNIVDSNIQGIFLDQSNNNTISGNILRYNGNAINLVSGHNNTISANNMTGCGITITGPAFGVSINDIDTTNLVNEKPVYFYANVNGLASNDFNNAGQVILVNCTDSVISDLDIAQTSIGISLISSTHNTILGNNLSKNNIGIDIQHSTNNSITENTVNDNELYGMDLWNSNNNTISGNTANGNNKGIDLKLSNNNTIYKNIANNNENYGIGLSGSANNFVLTNVLKYNYYGIYLRYSDNNTISWNRISSNINQNCIVEEFCEGNIFEQNSCNEQPETPEEPQFIISGYHILFILSVISFNSVILIKKRCLRHLKVI